MAASQAAAGLDSAVQHTPGHEYGTSTAAGQTYTTSTAAAAAAAATATVAGELPGHMYPAAVLQFLTTGLQKLGRQWHFLADPLAADLCDALVAAMVEPIVMYYPHISTAAAAATAAAPQQGADIIQSAAGSGQGLSVQQPQQSSKLSSHGRDVQQQQHDHEAQHEQQHVQQYLQQRQQQETLLVVQLLQHDPMLSWWHRLHANSASSRPLKAAAQQQGLPVLLLHWATHWLQQQQQQQQTQTQQEQQQQQQQHADNSTTTGTSHTQAMVDCVAVHCLAVFLGTPSGRQILQALPQQQAASPPQQALPQQQQQQQQSQHAQRCQQVAGVGHVQCMPLALTLQCMQGWAGLQCSSSGASSSTASSSVPSEAAQPAQQAQAPQPFTPWGPAKPAGLAAVTAVATATHTPAALQSGEAGQDPAAAAVAADCVEDQQPGSGPAGGSDAAGAGVLLCDVATQAAAATAAWALQAYEEQLPWF
jgi:hypothetical protein